MTQGKTSSADSSGGPVASVRVSAATSSSPATTPKSERNSSLEVLLQVQLWTAETTERAALPPIAVAMVADLLSSSACEIRDNPSASFAAVFRGAAPAINSTRQIHRLLQGFSKAGGGVRLGGCFILSSPEEGKLAELDVRGRLHTLAADYSGQILLVGGFCKAAQSVPGLRLESLEQAVGGQTSIVLLLPPAQWKGNTASVSELWAPLPVTEVARVDPKLVPEPTLDTTVWNVSSRPLSFVETQDLVRLPLRSGVDDDPAAADPARRRRLVTWVAGGAVAAVVVAGVIFVSGNAKVRPAPNAPSPAPAPNTVKQTSVSNPAPNQVHEGALPKRPQTSPPKQDSGPTAPKPPAINGRNDGPAKPRPPDARQSPTDGPRVPDTVDKGKGVIQFGPEEVNLMIANADKDAGDGRYEKAIQEYRIALRYEPKNQHALQGLARAVRNQEQQ